MIRNSSIYPHAGCASRHYTTLRARCHRVPSPQTTRLTKMGPARDGYPCPRPQTPVMTPDRSAGDRYHGAGGSVDVPVSQRTGKQTTEATRRRWWPGTGGRCITRRRLGRAPAAPPTPLPPVVDEDEDGRRGASRSVVSSARVGTIRPCAPGIAVRPPRQRTYRSGGPARVTKCPCPCP